MARPHKNNVDYFSHDTNMRDDPKMKAIRKKFGHLGYSIFNMLIEFIADSEYFKIELSDLNYELISGDFDIELDELKNIIEYFIRLDLFQFDTETNFLTNKTLENRLSGVLSKRKRERIAVIDADNTQSKVKETKENKSKVKKIEIESKINNNIIFPFETLKVELLNSTIWHNEMGIHYKIPVKIIRGKLVKWLDEQKIDNNLHRTLKDIKVHFRNSLKYSKDNQQPEEQTYQRPKDIPKDEKDVNLIKKVYKNLETNAQKERSDNKDKPLRNLIDK